MFFKRSQINQDGNQTKYGLIKEVNFTWYSGEYNNTYNREIKMKPVDVKGYTYIDFKKEVIIKILNLRLVIM